MFEEHPSETTRSILEYNWICFKKNGVLLQFMQQNYGKASPCIIRGLYSRQYCKSEFNQRQFLQSKSRILFVQMFVESVFPFFVPLFLGSYTRRDTALTSTILDFNITRITYLQTLVPRFRRQFHQRNGFLPLPHFRHNDHLASRHYSRVLWT